MNYNDLTLIDKKYRVIYADPPWSFHSWSKKGEAKSATQHYSCMSLVDIQQLPINNIAEENAIMFMWATDPLLPRQIEIMEGWGFVYKTVGFVWTKMNTKSNTPFIGLGYYSRSNPEYCLIGVKGKIGRPKDRSISQVVMSPIREHSRKPDIVRKHIMNMFDGPYFELFAREQTTNWDCFGDETQKFNSIF